MSHVGVGILIIDNNCYKLLADSATRSRFLKRAAMLDLIPAPSTLNLAESLCAAPAQRAKLLPAMRAVMGTYPLLPWPFEMLKQAGENISAGSGHGFDYGETGYEWLLEEPEAVGDDWRFTHAALREAEVKTSERFAGQRARIQRWIRDHNARDQWSGARAFLDYWWEGDMADTAARFYWRQLGLKGEPPVQALFDNEAWRLIIDAEGFAMYARCVVFEQTRKVGYMDLVQLPYLSIRKKRVLVTNDGPLYHAAKAILPQRYALADVVTLESFLA